MSKLFSVLLGGRAKGCNTELHDTVFVVGDSLEETYPQLIDKWFGIPNRLHIDCSIELNHVDGHEITLSTKPTDNQNKSLYFVNFGAYKPNYYGELHEINFYVASSKPEVLARAKQDLCTSFITPHCDDNIDVDDIISINAIDNYHIHLHPSKITAPLAIKIGYHRLTAPEVTA